MNVFKKLCAILLVFSFLIPCIPAHAQDEYEMRAVWVSTVYGLDYPTKATTNPVTLKNQADRIIENAKKMGMTAIILQVRPSSDALYPSKLYPWSKYLTGTSGLAPDSNFDPLAYWVRRAHEEGLELHAWLNPFRVAVSDSDYNSLSSKHPGKIYPEWVVRHTNGQYYFDPGIDDVREYILDGVNEIIENYDVDGIHLDDYFYPDSSFDDEKTFNENSRGFDDRDEWRRDNINLLVTGLDELCGKLTFGISVAGIWANKSSHPYGSETNGNQTFFSHYADSRAWVKSGWVDYIAPQIYWQIGHKSADYKTLVEWWANTVDGTGVELYIGMADYQACNTDKNSVWYGTSEIERQLKLNRETPQVSGEMHFRYKFLEDNSELFNLYSQKYTGEVPPPEFEDEEEGEDENQDLPTYTHSPYMQGTNGKFNPQGQLTRAQAAIIFARLMLNKDGSPAYDEKGSYPCSFKDVEAGAWYKNAIGFMESYRILTGYSDGTFRPNDKITRAEFATLVARFEKAEIKDNASVFNDLPSEHWASGYVLYAVKNGYISGYADNTFKPQNNITRAEAVKITNRMLARSPDTAFIDKYPQVNAFSDLKKDHWAYYEIIEASYEHAFSRVDGGEKWKTTKRPQIPFVSDTFDFVFPELVIAEPLVELDLSGVSAIALHHMAHPTADFKTVEGWHIDQGWSAFGYNFWISFEGEIYVARGWNVAAGVKNKNSSIISIGFQGDYEEANKSMPEAQYKAGVELIKWITERVSGIKEIGGHGDYGATLCPGKYFPLEEMKKDSGF